VELGPYAGFILAAYGVAALVVAALVAWVLIDHAAQRRVLRDLEARGISRRSDERKAVS
jgi:heme exporter protein D